MSSPTTLRVGSVPYLVARPLDRGLEEEPGIELRREVPARLVESLRSGAIDVALVSAIELFRRPDYTWIDGMGVAGEGFVSSVQLFLRKALEEVRTIALDPASRASATLVRVLCAQRGLSPGWIEPGLEEDARALPSDAWLRIGDRALREYLDPEAPPVFNPSAAWREWTGLPFVFAVWIVRPGLDLAPWREAFERSAATGGDSLEELVGEAAHSWSLEAGAVRRYLAEECLYRPAERTRAALFAFRDAAAPLDLCRADLEPAAI